jgi:tRNA modification GTPase
VSSDSRSLDHDTIAAIATPSGRGGVSIIRVSGPEALSIAELLTQKTVKARQPLLTRFFAEDSGVIDTGLTLFFQSPASFTGEDVVEFHCHGGVMVTNLLLEACLALGARLARPGEFSERAFLNNKMDLTQAEGLADLIDAPTQQAARQASASLQGAFSSAVNQVNQRIIDLRVYVEAAIDFPEEEVDFLSEGRVAATLLELKAALATLITQARRGALLSRGAQIVMTGAPNAGKSSLMNQLANQTVAIVTDIPGTTRDVIKQTISIEGVAIQLSDTAGIRAATDAIEQEGIERAQAAVDTADIIIEVVDDREPKRDRALLQRQCAAVNPRAEQNRPLWSRARGGESDRPRR